MRALQHLSNRVRAEIAVPGCDLLSAGGQQVDQPLLQIYTGVLVQVPHCIRS